MAGSALGPIVIPIVTVIVLAIWLPMAFYTDAHPRTGKEKAARHRKDPRRRLEDLHPSSTAHAGQLHSDRLFRI
jgi:hypothetical protein